MIDLDAKIRSLVERNIPRKDIVSELDAIASDPESRAKRFERAKKKGDRYRAESERTLSARVECAELRAELEAQRAAHEHLSAGNAIGLSGTKARAVVGDGSSLSPTVLWLRPVGDSSATLFSLKLAFAGPCPYFHSRDAQANLPGDKVATDSLDG